MKERPILFSAPMVRAILEGRKTQTRRLVKPQPPADAVTCGPNSYEGPGGPTWWWFKDDAAKVWPKPLDGKAMSCPYGAPGDRLWVKETFRLHRNWDDAPPSQVFASESNRVWYEADDRIMPVETSHWGRKRSSLHMPQKLSRCTLEVVKVRVERVRDISERDAVAEGSNCAPGGSHILTVREHFLDTFFNIKKRAEPDSNPWVWVVEFKKVGGT